MFDKYNTNNINALITDMEEVLLYIQNNLNGTIPNIYKIKQGRIVIDSNEEFDLFVNNLYKN